MIKTRRSSSSIRPVAILAIAIAGLYFARDILIPIAFAFTLTFSLAPVVGWLQKLHVRRVPAVILVVLLSVTAAASIASLLAYQLVDVANQLPLYRQNIHNKIEALRTPGKGALQRAANTVKELGIELSGPEISTPAASQGKLRQPQSGQPVRVQIVEPSVNSLQSLRDFVKPFLAPLGTAGVVMIFTIFMLIEREDLRNRLLRLVGLGQLNAMTQALDEATQRVSRYLLLQFLVNACFGILFGIGLHFIGIPYAPLWGAVAAIFRIVPYVGTLAAALLPMTLSFAVFDDWRPLLYVFVLFVTLELGTANLLEPWLYGSHTGVSSLAILITTIFWAVLWGPAGLILSTPLTVCVAVLGRYVPQLSFLHVLLGDEPVLDAEAQLYQRLLAMDQVEARAIVDDFLKEKPLIELYDGVFIPALTMAEQDRHKGELDLVREEFLFLSINEMVAEFSEKRPGENVFPERPAMPASECRLLCLPANDAADEITGSMLAQLWEHEGGVALLFPLGLPLHDLIMLLQPSATDVVCISALPPFAFAHARTLCRQLRTHLPNIRIVVGIWGFIGDAEKALQRFEPSHPTRLVSSFAQAIEQIGALTRPDVEEARRRAAQASAT
jgi:predicted PurR-regulated permease PerM